MQDATTWQDWVLVGGTIVSAVAAVVAIIYARRTVGEARALRREDRLDRLSQLVIDYGTVIQTHLVVGVAADQSRLSARAFVARLQRPACRYPHARRSSHSTEAAKAR